MAKPTKQQQAVLQLLRIVNDEGLHYGIVDYGTQDQQKVIKDEKLNTLIKAFKKSSNDLEKYLKVLEISVEKFDKDEDYE